MNIYVCEYISQSNIYVCEYISQSRVDVIQKFQEFVSVLWRDTESLKSITLYVFLQIIRE